MIEHFQQYDKEYLKSAWGVYAIERMDTGRRYIGSTADCFLSRWKTHWFSLRAGKNDNKALQWDWTFYGADRFRFLILETYPEFPNPRHWRSHPDAWAQHREAVLTAAYPSLYNSRLPFPSMIEGVKAKRRCQEQWHMFYNAE